MKKFNFKIIILNISIAVCVLYASLLGAEAILRTMYLQDLPHKKPDIYQYDEILGWVYKRNGSFKTLSPDAKERVYFDFNSDGIRHGEYNPKKKKILLVGDSTTGAVQVNMANHFGAIINESYSEYEVINAGINGYSTDQAYMTMQKFIENHDVVMVLYLINPNDIIGNIFTKIDIDVYRYSKPYFKVKNNRPYKVDNPAKKRDLINEILINKELVYLLEYDGSKNLADTIKKSSIYGKSYKNAKSLRNNTKEVFGEEKGINVAKTILARYRSPSIVRKVLRRREAAKQIGEPSLWSLFVMRKRLSKLFSQNEAEVQVSNSDELYQEITKGDIWAKKQRPPLIKKAWHITELLLSDMNEFSKENNATFIIIPHLNYLAQYRYTEYVKLMEANLSEQYQVDKFHRDLEAVAAKYDIPIAMEVLKVAKAKHSNQKHYNFKNKEGRTINGHYSKRGHRITAEGIIEHIRSNNWLK